MPNIKVCDTCDGKNRFAENSDDTTCAKCLANPRPKVEKPAGKNVRKNK